MLHVKLNLIKLWHNKSAIALHFTQLVFIVYLLLSVPTVRTDRIF